MEFDVYYVKIYQCTNEKCSDYITPADAVDNDYRCPLCEDYPLHSLVFKDDLLVNTPKINEQDLFELTIPEGCVINRLVQPGNIEYGPSGRPLYQIACCLLKEAVCCA